MVQQQHFYTFPKKETDLYKEWLKFCGVEKSNVKNPYICDIHFDAHSKLKKKLRANSFPTINFPKTEKLPAKKKTRPSKLKCVIENCLNRTSVNTNCKFFNFPKKNAKLYKTWVDICGLSETVECKKSKVLCSNYFNPEDYGKRKLNRNAVPTRNIFLRNQVKEELLDSAINTCTDPPLIHHELPALHVYDDGPNSSRQIQPVSILIEDVFHFSESEEVINQNEREETPTTMQNDSVCMDIDNATCSSCHKMQKRLRIYFRRSVKYEDFYKQKSAKIKDEIKTIQICVETKQNR